MSDAFEQQWLDDLPKSWNEKRADFLCDLYRVTIDPSVFGDDLVAHYSIPRVQETGGPLIEPASDIESTKLLIIEPTLLVSKLNPRKRTICIAEPQDGYVTLASGEFVAIKSDAMDRRYAYYLWHSEKVTDRLSALVQSATRSHQRVNPADILKLPWKWPPLETQRQISRFLDERTARIDGLIEKKRTLLERLAEQRQALITRAVTKGLNAEAPMKPSGIDWLGDIPANWQVKRLSFVTDVIDCKHRTPEYVDDGIPLVSTTEVKPFRIDYATKRMVSDDEFEQMSEGGRKLHPGDIIYSRNASVGSAALVKTADPLCLGQDLCLIRPREINPEFLEFFLNSRACLEQLDRELVGATFKRVNVDTIKKYFTLLPPAAEQDAIVSGLNERLAKEDACSSNVERSLDLLIEYRAATITAAVTGQMADLA